MQQVENTTSNRFLLALQRCKAYNKHAHTPHSSAHTRQCTSSVHCLYLQLAAVRTNVWSNKYWNVQPLENTTSNRFLLALQCCKARTKHAHTLHSSEHARRCTFSVHRSYIQLIHTTHTNTFLHHCNTATSTNILAKVQFMTPTIESQKTI